MDRLNLKFLLVALDKKLLQIMSLIPDIFTTFYVGRHLHVDEVSHTFRSQQFNLISQRKIEAVFEILILGTVIVNIIANIIIPYFIRI